MEKLQFLYGKNQHGKIGKFIKLKSLGVSMSWFLYTLGQRSELWKGSNKDDRAIHFENVNKFLNNLSIKSTFVLQIRVNLYF